jgi:tetratricopeptide (TPR) repeat protein
MHRGNKDSALYYSDLALTYGRRSSGKKMMDESLNIKALIFNYFGQIELSVAKNILAADWAERTNDKYHLAQYYREIGMAQRLIHNPAAAEFYLNRSYSYSRQIADYRQMALSLIGLAYILYDQQEYDAAVLKINEALRKMTSIHDNISIGEAHNLLGLVYREKKHYRKASISLANALLFFQSARNLEKIAEVYHNAGSLFVRQKKIKKALNYLFRSVDLRKKSGDRYQLCESYRVISQIYRDLGQPAKALVYLENYVRTLDSNSLVSATKQIADLSENYRSELRFRLIQSQADSIVQQQKNKALTETKLENSQLRNDLQLYIIIVMLLFAFLAGIIIFYRTKQVKLKQQQRETELSQTLLRAQMNPHFVFNAMSVIQSYIYENDTINSTKFLVNFSRLMRLILENSSREFIPVETEIEILEKYLAIQKLRFGDRFDFTIDMSENITPERAVIPPMITQPFVENAIEHGQLHANEEGTIYIRFRRSEKYLEVTIEDNGIGRSHAEQNKKSRTHKSMAMTITRERIQILNKKYGTEGFLDVQDLHPDRKTGTKVLIWLPYREDNLPTSET